MRVVGRKVHPDAFGTIYIGGVFKIIAVETDGRARGDGTGEGILQQAHLIFINIHVGETILKHRGENIAGVEEIVDAVAALAQNYRLVSMGRLAIDFARHVLVYGDGQNEFARLVTGFDVLFKEGHFLELAFFKNLVGHVVERKGELGIFVNAVVVVT